MKQMTVGEWTLFTNEDVPPEYKLVLVQISGAEEIGMPPSVAVGYLRFAAGDKRCPYFVVPGFGRRFEVTHWIDCLPENLSPPLWPGFKKVSNSEEPIISKERAAMIARESVLDIDCSAIEAEGVVRRTREAIAKAIEEGKPLAFPE